MAYVKQGLVAFVTGGASGLGRATAEHLISRGARVTIADLPSSKGGKAANSLGSNCIYTPVDVREEEDVQKALKRTTEAFGSVNVVVNCAGISGAYGIINKKDETHKFEDFANQLLVNCCGTFNVIRLAAKVMHANTPDVNGQRGVIINTASSAAFDGCSGQSAYAASQGAIVGMTLPIARDLSLYGIRCVTLAPGYFNTILVKSIPERVIKMFTEMTPFPHRLGDPKEFAQCVQSVIENPMLNGSTIRVDGGLRLAF